MWTPYGYCPSSQICCPMWASISWRVLNFPFQSHDACIGGTTKWQAEDHNVALPLTVPKLLDTINICFFLHNDVACCFLVPHDLTWSNFSFFFFGSAFQRCSGSTFAIVRSGFHDYRFQLFRGRAHAIYSSFHRCTTCYKDAAQTSQKVHHKNGKAAPTTNHVGRRPVLQRAKKNSISQQKKSLPYMMKAHMSFKNTSFCTNMAHFKPRKAFSVHVLSLQQQLFDHLRTRELSSKHFY